MKRKNVYNCGNKYSCPWTEILMWVKHYLPSRLCHPTKEKTLLFPSFKEQYKNHTWSFRNKWYQNVTELSKHIWNLKHHNLSNCKNKWRKVKQMKAYSNINKKCNLCIWKKFFIICKPEMSTRNYRNELTLKFLLNTVIAYYNKSYKIIFFCKVIWCFHHPSNNISICQTGRHWLSPLFLAVARSMKEVRNLK